MNGFLLQADQLERSLCLRINGLSRFSPLTNVFRVVSRLGDGVLWYSVLAVVALLGGWAGVRGMLHIGITSLVGVALYKFLKNRLVRQRPFVSHGQIVCRTAPLDQYSFPSGHTLHAVLFTVMLSAYVPALLPWLVVFAVLVAFSRVILGLHYPSDVFVGASLGALLAWISLLVVEFDALTVATSLTSWIEIWRS
ncbi:MAG: phosphatase PAP2 family protein [Pseudomonadota bacterium]